MFLSQRLGTKGKVLDGTVLKISKKCKQNCKVNFSYTALPQKQSIMTQPADQDIIEAPFTAAGYEKALLLYQSSQSATRPNLSPRLGQLLKVNPSNYMINKFTRNTKTKNKTQILSGRSVLWHKERVKEHQKRPKEGEKSAELDTTGKM